MLRSSLAIASQKTERSPSGASALGMTCCLPRLSSSSCSHSFQNAGLALGPEKPLFGCVGAGGDNLVLPCDLPKSCRLSARNWLPGPAWFLVIRCDQCLVMLQNMVHSYTESKQGTNSHMYSNLLYFPSSGVTSLHCGFVWLYELSNMCLCPK